jgi:hypothetical protein
MPVVPLHLLLPVLRLLLLPCLHPLLIVASSDQALPAGGTQGWLLLLPVAPASDLLL